MKIPAFRTFTVPLGEHVRVRLSIYLSPLLPPLSRLSLPLSRSLSFPFTATHGKWQPYCTRATLANPRTHTTVKTSGKIVADRVRRGPAVSGTREFRSAGPGFTRETRESWNDTRHGTHGNTRIRYNEPLFTTRLRVRSAERMRASRWHPCSRPLILCAGRATRRQMATGSSIAAGETVGTLAWSPGTTRRVAHRTSISG